MEVEICPNCGSEMIVNKGYVTWCKDCDYNVDPVPKTEKRTKLEAVYIKIGDRLGRSMFEKMVESDSNRGSLVKWDRWAALLLATLIHGLAISSFVLSIYCLFHWKDGTWNKILGVFFLLASWVMRPRVNKLEKGEHLLTRENMPNTFLVLDELAGKVGIKPIHGIVLNGMFNASVMSLGFTGKTVLFIGLPLFAVLTKEERLSLFAHEFGHVANKDLKRSNYIRTALNTLATWFDLIYPEGNMNGFLSWVSNYFLKFISFIPYGVYYILVHLFWQESQRAEYLADKFEASITGTEVAVSSMHKLLYNDLFDFTVQRTALAKRKSGLIEQFLLQVQALPENEMNRLVRKSERNQTRLDITHPPLAFRIKFLEKNKVYATMSISNEKNAAVEKELDYYKSNIESKLVEEYLYYLS